VVVHEFTTAGLPLILSEHVGARPQFLIDGLNGHTFFNDSAEELAAKMHQIANLTNDRLMQMAKISATLAQRVTPSLAAASFISALGLKTSRG
jgi:glycosyltransferase involved in cell wall biosynthesis